MSTNLYRTCNVGWLWSQCRWNAHHLELNCGTSIYFAFLMWHKCSSHLVTVFLGILWSSLNEIEVPYVFDWEHGIPLQATQGKRASSCGEGDVPWIFSSCGRNLWYILELGWGWPFVTRVCSLKSGLLSSYDGHLRNLNLAWQDNTDASGCEAGGPASLISWHSYIGIPINFHEESGIVTFWSIDFRLPRVVSKGSEAACPEKAET